MVLHEAVLLNEVLEMARGTPSPVRRFFDGTFGRGGHTRALLEAFPNGTGVVMDRDQEALDYGKTEFRSDIESGRLRLVYGAYAAFSNMDLGQFDLALLDLGVSSPQLDQAARGFSFMQDGPLDMRMDQSQTLTAAEIVNTWDEEDLVRIFRDLGEIRRPERVVRAVVHDRREQPFRTTRELSELIARVDGWRRRGHHPATQYFLALRLTVNQELEQVQEGVFSLMQALHSGGRLLVITFHSLEDRIVKNLFKEHPGLGKPVNKKVIKPTWNEQKKNPRSRSAQLRGFERI